MFVDRLPALLLLLLLQVGCNCNKQSFIEGKTVYGKVVGITDGDTFTLLTKQNKQEKIRLYGIDCPERRQPFGTVAKQELSKLVFGKQVMVEFKTLDRWNRIVGMVYVDNLNVNEEMLKKGVAWHFKKHDRSTSFAELEDQARSSKRGLWADPNPVPPWDWRKNK